MHCGKNRTKLDVFQYKTTYENDYRPCLGRVKNPANTNVGTGCKVESTDIQKRTPPGHVYKDNESFVKWRADAKVPFSLLWKRKEIINTDPYEPFGVIQVDSKERDNHADIVKTRPRIYKSPAVSIDDVTDPEMRQLLIDNMYTTDWRKATQESKITTPKKHINNTTIEMGGDPVKLKIDLLPPLPNNFKNLGKTWEDKQHRDSVDPTTAFWTHKDPPVICGACNDPLKGIVGDATKDEIRRLIEEDKLRLPHDYAIPGYCGYIPLMVCDGIPLAKMTADVVHPFLSVTQAINRRYMKNDASKNQ